MITFIRTTGNIQTPIICSTDSAISTDEHGEREFLSQLDESAAESVNEECDTPKPQCKRKEQITPFQKNLLDLMKNPPVHELEDFDPDKYFLLSLLPDIKKMTESQKLDLKIEFMQSVKNILSPSQSLPIDQSLTKSKTI